MTADSDRDEIHATADPDSAGDADPSLTDGEHPADDELSDSAESPDDDESADDDESSATDDSLATSESLARDESPASGEAVSDSAEDQDDDAEDQDDDQIIVERSDVVSPIAMPGQAADSSDQDGTDDDEVASAVVVTEVASDPYGQETDDENELNDEESVGTHDAADAAAGYDGAGTASVDEAPPVPAPAHERTPADTGLGGDTALAGDGEEIHQRWAAIQSSFVDDPHQSVADAAAFLEETTAALVASIQQRESELRGEWDNQSLDTEGLRTMLRKYRAVLDRISAL